LEQKQAPFGVPDLLRKISKFSIFRQRQIGAWWALEGETPMLDEFERAEVAQLIKKR
jgi:hypothetical protein